MPNSHLPDVDLIMINITFANKSLSPVSTTTPCPTTDWSLVTWKESDAYMLLSVLVARASTHGSSLILEPTKETPPLHVQSDQGAQVKTKDPKFRYTA
ncbi:unnamed protein product [Spirodela intermedia]|uniref:Uncharacterized protein n=1 Tax=Spirodela intermedia TaxID=51605 RepID=A0A7I8LBG7_SPIIN|nr:unnamed protein product [Spirodela intermedia]